METVNLILGIIASIASIAAAVISAPKQARDQVNQKSLSDNCRPLQVKLPQTS